MNPSSPSTSSCEEQRAQIKVPRNSSENRELKDGHVEDNNEDIAYFNFRLLWPNLFFAIFAISSFAAAVIGSLRTDFVPGPLQLLHGYIVEYGASRFACNSSIPFPSGGLPSVLNLFELNVVGNVFFRLATCIPMAVRIFNSFTVRSILCVEYEGRMSLPHRFVNDFVPVLTVVEVFAMALFSIVTVHSDFPEVNRYCKIVFVMCAGINMLLSTILTFSYGKNSEEKLDSFSCAVKLVCSATFGYVAPQYFQHHNTSISYPGDRSFLLPVAQSIAFMEYGMVVAYGVFHLTSLIDIRDVTFTCYPRTCGGECEPLRPENFEKGAKFEYCRAFEYNQRKTLNL